MSRMANDKLLKRIKRMSVEELQAQKAALEAAIRQKTREDKELARKRRTRALILIGERVAAEAKAGAGSVDLRDLIASVELIVKERKQTVDLRPYLEL